jgi:hypothetical protein
MGCSTWVIRPRGSRPDQSSISRPTSAMRADSPCGCTRARPPDARLYRGAPGRLRAPPPIVSVVCESVAPHHTERSENRPPEHGRFHRERGIWRLRPKVPARDS